MRLYIDIPRELLLGNEILIKVNDDASACHVLQSAKPVMLFEFMNALVSKFQHNGQVRLSETYAATLRSLSRFLGGKDVDMRTIDKAMAEDFETYLKHRDLTLNTISFYMRVLRAVYNRAIRDQTIANRRPFDHVFTGTAKTQKRAVSMGTLRKIATLQLSSPTEQLARDLFLFSFYTRGMSFIDIAFLRTTDIRDGHLVYKRKKTGQELRIAWRKEMQHIVDRHPSLDGIHLLGILDERSGQDLRRQYHSRQCLVNQALRRLSLRQNLGVNLTMYVARHSWATIARELNVPMGIISGGMGHESEKTTAIYLASVNSAVIDRSNDLLIEAVEGRKKRWRC